MSPFWLVTPEKVREAVRRIVSAQRPKRIILFGSASRGEVGLNSDADFLVITDQEMSSPRRESVRLRRALRGLSMPMDILVISERRLKELSNQPGLIYLEALRSGKVVYEAAA